MRSRRTVQASRVGALKISRLAGGALRAPWALAAEPAHQYYLLPHAADGPAAAFAGWLRDTCSEAAREAQALLSGVT